MRNAFHLTGYPELGTGKVRDRLRGKNQPLQGAETGSAKYAVQGKKMISLLFFCFVLFFLSKVGRRSLFFYKVFFYPAAAAGTNVLFLSLIGSGTLVLLLRIAHTHIYRPIFSFVCPPLTSPLSCRPGIGLAADSREVLQLPWLASGGGGEREVCLVQRMYIT